MSHLHLMRSTYNSSVKKKKIACKMLKSEGEIVPLKKTFYKISYVNKSISRWLFNRY